jgi:hypothetical protein
MNRRTLLIIVGIVVAVVVLVTVFDMILADHPPAIAGLEAPEMVTPSGTCQIVCVASDRDGDALSYNWSASGGSISGTGVAVNWTAPESLGSYNVTVTVTDGRGEEVSKQIAIGVRANRPPAINSLVADADWTNPSATIQVTCTASDPDGDKLTYEWAATAGDVSGTGAIMNWTAPQEAGVCNITVVVKDAHDSEDAMFIPLSVNLGTPPTAEKLVVTAIGNNNIYLRKGSSPGCDFDVWKGTPTNPREYDIECIASDTGELFYDWSCTDGSISGTGSNITWTAPNKQSTGTVSVEVVVTVIVSDGDGNSIAKNVVFYMATCSCGSWGPKSGEISF